jgi:hypothetical protein
MESTAVSGFDEVSVVTVSWAVTPSFGTKGSPPRSAQPAKMKVAVNADIAIRNMTTDTKVWPDVRQALHALTSIVSRETW